LDDAAGPLAAGLVSLENDLDDETRVDLMPELPVHRSILPPEGSAVNLRALSAYLQADAEPQMANLGDRQYGSMPMTLLMHMLGHPLQPENT
jgi:hypothetical protein